MAARLSTNVVLLGFLLATPSSEPHTKQRLASAGHVEICFYLSQYLFSSYRWSPKLCCSSHVTLRRPFSLPSTKARRILNFGWTSHLRRVAGPEGPAISRVPGANMTGNSRGATATSPQALASDEMIGCKNPNMLVRVRRVKTIQQSATRGARHTGKLVRESHPPHTLRNETVSLGHSLPKGAGKKPGLGHAEELTQRPARFHFYKHIAF